MESNIEVRKKEETVDGDIIRVRLSTEAEDELAVIYSLLDANANPIGKVKSVVHPNPPSPKSSY